VWNFACCAHQSPKIEIGTARQTKTMFRNKDWRNFARGMLAKVMDDIREIKYARLPNKSATGVAWYIARNIMEGRAALSFSREEWVYVLA